VMGCNVNLKFRRRERKVIYIELKGRKMILLVLGLMVFPWSLYAEQVVQPLQLRLLVQEVSSRNSDAILKYMKYKMARQSNEYEKGVFEPDFFVNASHTDIKVPNTVQELFLEGFKISTQKGLRSMQWVLEDWHLVVHSGNLVLMKRLELQV